MAFSVGSVSSNNVSSIPSASEMSSFSDGLKSASSNDLLKALNDPKMAPWQKDAIANELQSRAQKSNEASGGGGAGGADDSDPQALLKKLLNGTISPEELQKLAGTLGVSTDSLEAVKGKGGSSEGTSATADIAGG